MICASCQKNLDISLFVPSATSKTGYYNSCRECRKEIYKPKYRKNRGAGFVYLFRADNGRVKIGYTSQTPEKRLRSCLASSPIDISIIGYMESDRAGQIETELHIQYAKYHYRHEWYDVPDDILNEIKQYFATAARPKP